MNWYSLRHAASAVVILMAIAACVLPSQTTQQPLAIQPTPGIDSNVIATAVAGTAQAAATQTATMQPTATQTPTARPVTGTSLEQLPDGTTTYTDYEGGFQISFPAGWLTVSANSEEFKDALLKDGATNLTGTEQPSPYEQFLLENGTPGPMLQDQMTSELAAYVSELHQLYAYKASPDTTTSFSSAFASLVWVPDNTMLIDEPTLKQLVTALEDQGETGFHVDSAQIHEDKPVKIMEINISTMMGDDQASTISMYMTMIAFKPSPDTLAQIVFAYMGDEYTQISPDVKFVIGSIRILGP